MGQSGWVVKSKSYSISEAWNLESFGYRDGGLISFPPQAFSGRPHLRYVLWHKWHSHSSVDCLKRTIWVPSKWFFIPLAVAEVSGLVTWTCEGIPCCSAACFGSSCHIPCEDRVLDLATRLTGIVLVRSCSGLGTVETEILIVTAMVIDLIVYPVVAGRLTVGLVYPCDSLTLLTYSRLASFRRCLWAFWCDFG